jgi:tetratricopeptide (TPR) repeat protein
MNILPSKYFSSANLMRGMKAATYCFVLLLAAGCQTIVYEGDVGTQALMSLPVARQVIGSEVGKASFGGGYFEGVQVTIKEFSVSSPAAVAFIPAGRYSFQFDKIKHVAVIHEGDTFAIDIGPPWYVHWKSEADVRHFLDAVQAMKYYASDRPLADDKTSFAEFQKMAGAWRALPTKPLLPDQAQQYRVLAEDALRNKDLYKTTDYYEQGLAIAPLWPQAHFNLALLYGELEIYGLAVLHMKRYLELEPDAPDAQSTREQMIIWQSKLPKS